MIDKQSAYVAWQNWNSNNKLDDFVKYLSQIFDNSKIEDRGYCEEVVLCINNGIV